MRVLRRGFNMIEIMIAVLVVTVGVFPVFYLMTSGNRGTTVSVREVVAMNHAANVMELLSGYSYDSLIRVMGGEDDVAVKQKGSMVYSNESHKMLMQEASAWETVNGGTQLLAWLNSKEVAEILPAMEVFYEREVRIKCQTALKYCLTSVVLEWDNEVGASRRRVDLKTAVVSR